VAWFDGAYAEMHRKWDGNMAAADANSLVHTSAPVARDTELTGTPVAHLWISADQPDVNVFAVVEDVSPDGTSRYVTDGRIRASWRKLVAAPWGGSA
ncbi:CocE/NonD family hydrolase C-terminal non-catalytic domain-containing protein, partial [Mycobacterium tuberculosis]